PISRHLALARRLRANMGAGSQDRAEPPDHDFPARGRSHPISFWYGSRRNFWDGSRRLRWNSFCWAAFLANTATWSSVCRFSFGRAIHSRMIFRRVSWSSMFAVPWVISSVTAGRVRASPTAASLFVLVGEPTGASVAICGRRNGRLWPPFVWLATRLHVLRFRPWRARSQSQRRVRPAVHVQPHGLPSPLFRSCG